MTELEAMFEAARKMYPGKCRPFEEEYGWFRKNYGMKAKDIIPLLIPAIKSQVAYRDACEKAKMWHENWQHFKTWLHPNSKGWTMEVPEIRTEPNRRVQTCMFCGNPSTVRMDTKGARCSSDECKRRFNEL